MEGYQEWIDDWEKFLKLVCRTSPETSNVISYISERVFDLFYKQVIWIEDIFLNEFMEISAINGAREDPIEKRNFIFKFGTLFQDYLLIFSDR